MQRIRRAEPRDRRKYLGGHDAARIVGIFPFGAGAADTYARIVHGVVPEKTPEMMRGMISEPGIHAWADTHRGVPSEPSVHVVDERGVPFFGGSLDAVELGETVAREYKTIFSYLRHSWGIPGTADVPKHVYVQCQWYMGLASSLREFRVYLWIIDGDDTEPLEYVVPRNDAAIEELRAQAESFWFDHIMRKVPPLAGVHDGNAEAALQACWPHQRASVIEDVDEALIEAAHDYAAARESFKVHEAAKKKASARLQALLGDHEGARWAGGSVSWKSRPLESKVNWEQVAHEIALKTKTPGEWFSGLVRENTFPAFSIRSLRVSIKREKPPKGAPAPKPDAAQRQADARASLAEMRDAVVAAADDPFQED